ncbi:MAG: hypothetical protein LBH18_05375 [Spirochaetaceae bacterium]|jgi:diaminopimelate epimerase|nr:hypothetical protein [Spirochaetaceae bacterium]
MGMLYIVNANPAGNITIFVLNAQDFGMREREEVAKRLLADKMLRAEQVGFVTAPEDGGLWRLTMAGGEFCGNAARSFGLFAARKSGLRGRCSVAVEVSGAPSPITVEADCEAGTAAAALPPPRASGVLPYAGGMLPVYQFDGITHVIAEGVRPSEAEFWSIKKLFTKRSGGNPAAFGVMFYDTDEELMRPAVYVKATKTLVFESSCGSGSAAFAYHRLASNTERSGVIEIRQPGGVITARLTKHDGLIEQIWIGGAVSISESFFNLDMPPDGWDRKAKREAAAMPGLSA